MNFPSAGELNRFALVRERADYPNDMDADAAPSFPRSFSTWVKIEPVGTAVHAASVQTDKVVTHRITLRYRDGITNSHEVVTRHAGRETVYVVRRSTDLRGARRFLVLEVEETWTNAP